MQNNQINSKENQVLILAFIVIQIIFIVFFIISFRGISQDDRINNQNDLPAITIENLSSEVPDLPEEYIDSIQTTLAGIVEFNQPDFNIPGSKAIIRHDSIVTHKFDENGFYALSFIVDIPNLEQSYQIYYQYPINTDDNTGSTAEDSLVQQVPRAVLCLDEKSQIIYPNFECRSNYPSNTRSRMVSDYLKLIFFNYFSVFIDEENDPKTIQITPITDPDEGTKELYIQEVKDIVSSLGVSPDLFHYKVLTSADFDYYNPE